MESELKSLILKVDKLMEMQELILERLNQSTILTKEPIINPKKLTKKEETDKMIEEFKLVFTHQHRLQKQFNLAVTPQRSRILAYLRSNDPKTFDGLKRNPN